MFRRDRERPEGYPVRRVLRGELFDSDELARGEVALEDIPPADEPAEEASECWAWRDKDMPEEVRERLRGYRDFLAQWRRDHPGEPDEGGPEPEEAG
jgi:hypothetical protein